MIARIQGCIFECVVVILHNINHVSDCGNNEQKWCYKCPNPFITFYYRLYYIAPPSKWENFASINLFTTYSAIPFTICLGICIKFVSSHVFNYGKRQMRLNYFKIRIIFWKLFQCFTRHSLHLEIMLNKLQRNLLLHMLL